MPIDSARLERIRKYNASQRAAAGMEPRSTAPTSGLRNPQAVSRFQASMRAANPDIVGRSSNTTSTAIARRSPAALGGKAGMGIFGPLAAAAAIAAADKATDYKRAKYTQNFGGPQFDLNPYARSNDRMSKGMKVGMGNTNPKVFERGHLSGFGGPVEELLGYGVSLVQRGQDFDNAKKLITGTEKFRKLSEPVQQAVLSHYDFWRASQSKGKNTKRIMDDMTKPAMRRPAGEPMPR